MDIWGEGYSRQWEEQVQRPCGLRGLGVSKEQQEEQCGQSRDREEHVVGEEGRVIGGRGTKERDRL